MKYAKHMLVAATALTLASSLVKAGTAEPARTEQNESRWSTETLDLSEEWGVEILGIRITASGYALDLRYRVTDAEKAAPIFERQNKPVLIDQESGREFQIGGSPTVGPMRSSYIPHVDRTYVMLFGNAGGYLRPGSKVNLEVGPFHAEGLTVR